MHKYTKIACALAILGYVSANLLFAPDGRGHGPQRPPHGHGHGPMHHGHHPFGGHHYERMIKAIEAAVEKETGDAKKVDLEKLAKIKELHEEIKQAETELNKKIEPLFDQKHKLVKELREKLNLKPEFGRGMHGNRGPGKGGFHGHGGGYHKKHNATNAQEKAVQAANTAQPKTAAENVR